MSLIPAPVRRGFDALLEPMARSLIAARITPNAITTVGTLVLVLGAVEYGRAQVEIGGALVLLSGLLDMLDGKVARSGMRITRFGAFYDSTLDRMGEVALFTGIGVYFLSGGVAREWLVPAIAVTMAALGSGLIVSYARARAEGLGLDCRVGIATRAERVLGLGVPSLFFGAGPGGLLLLIIVTLLALTAVITVIQRVAHVYGTTRVSESASEPRAAAPAVAEVRGKGSGSG